MNLFDVYPLFDVEIVRGKGCRVYDTHGTEYLDFMAAMPSSPSATHIPATCRAWSSRWSGWAFIPIR